MNILNLLRDIIKFFLFSVFFIFIIVSTCFPDSRMTGNEFCSDGQTVKLQTSQKGELKTYTLYTTALLRDNRPADKKRSFSESKDFSYIRSGNEMFDSLYALTLDDAELNAVDKIRDGSFDFRASMNNSFFQTGERWTYVWTRDISYSVDLALACVDCQRCKNSLLFKTTSFKPSIKGRYSRQIVQDTGSGGSYPVSTDRVVWSFGAWQLLKYLDSSQKAEFIKTVWPVMQGTIEQDRQLIFDSDDGLYRGEQSFLDWRQQSYPNWTSTNVLAIARAKALSTNIGHYQLLKTAAYLAGKKGLADYQSRYALWANSLKAAINREFYIESRGLYSSLILDEPVKIRLNRFDLLGQSMAINCGIADKDKAAKIISNYPHGRYGAPVVWPQEQTVPIYHNHALWPFVTAYWLRAAKITGNAPVAEKAIYSLIRATALNLSNMENLDFVSGLAFAEINGISGPEINSPRQLWSVAGYLSMVQDIIFGLETDYDGIRFLPFITSNIHSDYFKQSKKLCLKNFKYRNKIINITVNLPVLSQVNTGAYKINRICLDDKLISSDFVAFDSLSDNSHWEIWLSEADTDTKNSADINMVNDLSRENIFGPKQPQWQAVGCNGITVESGRLKLHYSANGETDVRFNIYRNGRLCQKGIAATEWIDPDSADYCKETYFYMLESYYPDSGNCSHLTCANSYASAEENVIEIAANSMKNKGGNLVNNHHFENWGQPEDEILVNSFTVEQSGCYLVSAEYSNGAGPINTGITCAVKRIEISQAGAGKVIAGDYLVMPHTADWQRYLSSSSFRVDLKTGKEYSIKIFENQYSRNMSYFEHYESYKGNGSGLKPYNYVNISKLKLIKIKD